MQFNIIVLTRCYDALTFYDVNASIIRRAIPPLYFIGIMVSLKIIAGSLFHLENLCVGEDATC